MDRCSCRLTLNLTKRPTVSERNNHLSLTSFIPSHFTHSPTVPTLPWHGTAPFPRRIGDGQRRSGPIQDPEKGRPLCFGSNVHGRTDLVDDAIVVANAAAWFGSSWAWQKGKDETEIHRKSGLIDRNVAWCRPARIDSNTIGGICISSGAIIVCLRWTRQSTLARSMCLALARRIRFRARQTSQRFFGQHECSPDRIDSFPRGETTTTAIAMAVRSSSSCSSSPSHTSP
jgi:hypothetical protein